MSCLFLSTIRLNRIINEKANINLQLNDLNEQLLDLQNYSATIANGSISMNDVANCPSSLFSQMMNFMSNSTASSMQAAQQNMSLFASSGQMPTFSDAASMQNYQNSLFQSFYKQKMDQWIKLETKLLNAKETKIQQQINKLQTRLTMLDKEESSCESSQQQSAGKSVANFVA